MRPLTDNDRTASYLGDGLYAKYDGYHVVLFASDGINVTNEVFLDADVMAMFLHYIAKISKEKIA